MDTAGVLYLVMVIVAMSGFALVLAYYSHQHTKAARRRAAQAPAERTAAETHVHA
jgi:hypothetical protein